MLKKAHLVKLGKTSPWRNKTVFNALHVIKTESAYQPLGSRGPGEAAEVAFGRTGWGCPVLHTAGSSLFCLQFCLVSNFPALILSFLAFVPSRTDLTEYLLHSSWQCEKFSSCFHPGYGLWGTDTASLSTHTSGYSDMYFPGLLCACCFCIALFTCTTEERTLPLQHACFILPVSLYKQHWGGRWQRRSAPQWGSQDGLYKRWFLHYIVLITNWRTTRKEHWKTTGLFNNMGWCEWQQH